MKIILFNETPLWILDPDVGAVGGEGRLKTLIILRQLKDPKL